MTVKSPASASGQSVSVRAAKVRGVPISPGCVTTRVAYPPGGDRRAYQPRAAERGVLHTIVREHLETFLREAAQRADSGKEIEPDWWCDSLTRRSGLTLFGRRLDLLRIVKVLPSCGRWMHRQS